MPKHFVKCLCPSKPFTKYFRKSFRNLPRNDNRKVYATFLIILKIFVQGCRNIGSKSSEPRYEYFEKLWLKHSARCSVIKVLAWNISINVFLKTWQKISWNDYVLCSIHKKNISEIVLRKIFLQVCGNIRSKSLWPRYGYFENIFRKVYARFCVSFRES